MSLSLMQWDPFSKGRRCFFNPNSPGRQGWDMLMLPLMLVIAIIFASICCNTWLWHACHNQHDPNDPLPSIPDREESEDP